MDYIRACALIARAPGLTARRLAFAVTELGCIERLAAAGSSLAALQLPEHTRNFLARTHHPDVDADLRWIDVSGAHLVPCTSADYPPLLKQIASPPPVLYVLGDKAVLHAPQLAMVGSRNPTAGGRATALEFAKYFARCGLTITSGLALGIDGACHEGALAGNGCTVAVCGNGLDTVYPREHRKLMDRICDNGAVVSQFPPRTSPTPTNFPKRNRIISGLSLGTLVVEAASGSGSLITAREAAEQGREVFAIPGSIHSALSRGCHELIRNGAKLVETAADVLEELKLSVPPQILARATSAPADTGMRPSVLDKDYEMLLDALGFEPATVDVIVERTGLPSGTVASMLLILELQGRIAPHPGGRYGRLS